MNELTTADIPHFQSRGNVPMVQRIEQENAARNADSECVSVLLMPISVKHRRVMGKLIKRSLKAIGKKEPF